MKKTLILMLMGVAGIAGYKASTLYLENQRLAQDELALRGQLDAEHTRTVREESHAAAVEAQKKQISKLNEDIQHEEQVLEGLDRQLDAIDRKQKDNFQAVQLSREINYERDVVSDLEAQIQAYKNGVNDESTALDSVRIRNRYLHQNSLNSLRYQIQAQQNQMKELRQRLSAAKKQGLSFDEKQQLNANYHQAQQRFEALGKQYAEARNAESSGHTQEGQMTGELKQYRTDLKTLQQQLAVEKKHLSELENEYRAQDKSDNADYQKRDRLYDQTFVEKNRLQSLRDNLASARAKLQQLLKNQ